MIKKLYKSTEETDLKINLSDVVVSSNEASVFAVGNDLDYQSSRVFAVFDDEGLLVEVMNKEGSKVVEQENLGVWQEFVFTDNVLEKYWSYQSPTVISALSDEFKISNWSKWNIVEDETPTEFQKYVGSENVGLQQAEPEVLEPAEGLISVDEEVISVEMDGIMPSDSFAGDDQELCSSITSFNGIAPIAGSEFGEWTLISGSGIINNDNDPYSSVSGLSIGENVFQWTITNDCGSTDDLVTIMVLDGNPQINPINDPIVCDLNLLLIQLHYLLSGL